MKYALAAAAMLVSTAAVAQAPAHEHGVGLLNIAIEGNLVAIELEAPGADIVGFEHDPATPAEQDAVNAALALLADPMAVLSLPPAAGCTVQSAEATLGEHDDHAAAGAPARAGEEDHTEFHAEYVLACSAIARLDAIDFPYFTLFPNTAELEVQMISGTGTRGAHVTRDAPRLDLSGLI